MTVTVSYLSISDCTVAPAGVWYASNSTFDSNSYGWTSATVSYLNIQDCAATPNLWLANNSTDSGNNTGWLFKYAYISATDAKDVASFTASNFNIALAATDAPDTVAVSLNLYAFVYLLTSEMPDTAAFDISVLNIALDATEATDTATFDLSISSIISMAAVETPDNYSQNAYILWLTPDQPDGPTIWVPNNDPTPYLTTVI